MALLDDLTKTGRKGVFYREHPTRKHGIRRDRQLVLRYTIAGKTRVEIYGWTSEKDEEGNHYTEIDAEKKIASFRENAKNGTGPTSLTEEREIKALRQAEKEEEQRLAQEAKDEEARKNITVAVFFRDTYLPHAKDHKKPDTWETEEQLFRLWIAPVIGDLPFLKVSPFHLDKIKSNMRQGKRQDTYRNSKPRPLSAKSIHHALATFRQIWNFARREKIVNDVWPGRDVKKPKVQNQKIRFLTHDEADKLLAALMEISHQLHDIALLSLHCGLRAGEIFGLKWDCVDSDGGTLLLVDTKNGESRHAYLTPMVKAMLEQRLAENREEKGDYVFLSRKGGRIHEVSATFGRIVDRIGFNDGVTDVRRKVTFHTLRHTYASWLVAAGVDLYTTGKMLGHKTVHMTARYSHVGENAQRQAARLLAATLDQTDANQEKIIHGDFSSKR